jgi:hypothetical protein
LGEWRGWWRVKSKAVLGWCIGGMVVCGGGDDGVNKMEFRGRDV